LVPCARLNWLFRQLLIASKYTISYIGSYRICLDWYCNSASSGQNCFGQKALLRE